MAEQYFTKQMNFYDKVNQIKATKNMLMVRDGVETVMALMLKYHSKVITKTFILNDCNYRRYKQIRSSTDTTEMLKYVSSELKEKPNKPN